MPKSSTHSNAKRPSVAACAVVTNDVAEGQNELGHW